MMVYIYLTINLSDIGVDIQRVLFHFVNEIEASFNYIFIDKIAKRFDF